MADESNPLGGLLGSYPTSQGLLGNPLFNFGLAYASQLGPSLTPSSPLQRLGRAGLAAGQAQSEALKNEYMRQKLAASKTETEAKSALLRYLTEGGGAGTAAGTGTSGAGGADPTLTALAFAAYPEQTISKLIQTPEQVAATAAAQEKLQQGKELAQDEFNKVNQAMARSVEANGIIDRLQNSPIKLGSTAARKLFDEQVSDDGNWHSVSATDFAKFVQAFSGGEKLTPSQLQAVQDDWDRFTKLSAQSILDAKNLDQAQAAQGQGGRVTNMGLGLLKSSNINPGISAVANKKILNESLQKQLSWAQSRGLTLPNAPGGEALAKTYSTELAPEKAVSYAPGGPPPPDVGQEAPQGIADQITSLGAQAVQKGLGFARGLLGGGGPLPAPDIPQVGAPGAAPPAAPPGPAPVGQPTVGYQNGRLVPQPPSVYKPLPSPAEAASVPGPAARAVKTQTIMSRTVPGVGNITAPQFPRKADGARGVGKGEYFFAPDENGKMALWQN